MEPYREKLLLDVSKLPSVSIGHKNVSWLGNIFYMVIEGTMFVLVIASYFYLRSRAVDWPPAPQVPPALTFGIANAAILVLSLVPARWIQKRAALANRNGVRSGLFILAAMALASIVVRWFEFASLHCRWTDNAYASTIWVLLGVHTGHLITEFIETTVIGVIACTSKMEGNRFADADTNSVYWYFVVATALLCDLIIYATPRFI
jgi:cytochrome c oxidase subunit III